MNAHNGRSSKFLRAVILAVATVLTTRPLIGIAVAAEDKPAGVANPAGVAVISGPTTPPGGQASSSSQRVLLVRASPVPLGDNSVIAVSPQEAKRELLGIDGGLFRRSLAEPKVQSVPEQGGWVRGFFKEPKASKLWSFFNPKAPLDTETDLMRSARIFGIRGDAPLPTSMQDPIQVEPVGIRFWQINR